MAARRFSAATAAVTLSSATVKTILQVKAPSAYRVRVLSVAVSFAGTSATAVPVFVRVIRQTTAGTMTSLTPRAIDVLNATASEAVQSTAQHTATVEPTASDVLLAFHVHPQTGIFRPVDLIIPIDGRIGIECTAAAGVDVIGEMICEE